MESKYGSTLVSSRKDQKLSYTKYVYDKNLALDQETINKNVDKQVTDLQNEKDSFVPITDEEINELADKYLY